MAKHTTAKIQAKAAEILERFQIVAAPVDVESIANRLGIDVRKTPAEDELSGFIVKRPDGHAVIGVNAIHHPNRQRFTIGHEIGHYLLHDFEQVHVDKFTFRLRDENSSTGQNDDEVQANRFAAELLMPRHFLVNDLPTFAPNGFLDERGLTKLAKHYLVSTQAMTTRLVSLGVIDGSALH